MSLNTWMICGLSLYVLFVIYVGFLGAKKIKGLSDFAVAGESMGPIPLGLAFAASFFSARLLWVMSDSVTPGALPASGSF